MADLLDDFLQRLRALAPELPERTALQLELQARQIWGGTDGNYIAKRPTMQRAAKIGEGLRAQKPMAQVFSDAGIGRSQGYRLLRRR